MVELAVQDSTEEREELVEAHLAEERDGWLLSCSAYTSSQVTGDVQTPCPLTTHYLLGGRMQTHKLQQ